MRKIYTKVVIDMKTGDVLEEEFYLYDGPVAEAYGALEMVSALGALAGIASTAYTMTQGSPKAPTAPTAAPDTSGIAAQSQAEALMKRRGMASTMLSNPMGGGAAPASTQRATLGM